MEIFSEKNLEKCLGSVELNNPYGNYGSYHPNGYGSNGYDSSNRYNGNYGNYDNDANNCNYDHRHNQYGYNNNRGNGYDSRGYNGYGGTYSSYLYGKGHTKRDIAFLRAKRSDTNEEQCISQCVFGYLEVLDDSRVPSETLVIKWLQEHLQDDMKRIKALRKARRCFGKLSTMDNKDGCDFSKSLSTCLNLELE
ncbi:hypothetical protein HHI36_001291 [Cryptolaemus montrouzieri]|uniref:Uncharacterized protein n=1 Tax=Cryptolaemus montrouzieri TaxID=559131 RepID=A0ABD2P7Y7_9CUCU